jgi:hypothetical protein
MKRFRHWSWMAVATISFGAFLGSQAPAMATTSADGFTILHATDNGMARSYCQTGKGVAVRLLGVRIDGACASVIGMAGEGYNSCGNQGGSACPSDNWTIGYASDTDI